MDEPQARLILQAYRPGSEENDPEAAEALQMAERDPALGRWLAEEQEFDRAMAAHLEAIPAPFGLKTRILAQGSPAAVESRPWSWAVKLAGVAALLFLLVQIASFFRPPPPPSAGVGDYASEMVSFIRLSPPLEMASDDLGAIKKWLAKEDIAPPDVPQRLADLRPAGCRILSFRGQKVTLICFKRDDAGLAHLFVVDRTAMPQMKPGDKPVLRQEGDWATATWVEKDSVYLVAAEGGPADVQRFLPST
ncbi:MAG: hypothetical protein ABIR38_02070 [Chthoniobacterales bacterium]